MTRPSKKHTSTLALLREYESRNVTWFDPDGSWPIVWERARGVNVWDASGRKYLDLTAAFGVAAAGHANPRVVGAGQKQMARLLHAMGDVHPHALKGELARELSALTFGRWAAAERGLQSAGTQKGEKGVERGSGERGKTIFCNSGFEAVEAALKTARLATGRSEIVAFEGAYHGLGYGALNATHRGHFREPFRPQMREFAHFVPFPGPPPPECTRRPRQGARGSAEPNASLAAVESRLRTLSGSRRGKLGAVLVEPVQVRGGVNIPPAGFLPMLRRWCDETGALLILDEIYTGFGRTGKWFACEHSQVIPDLICLGKALTGGFPLSACVGRAEVMDAAWLPSSGEAIHTSTFLGHPVGCAMALAQLREVEAFGLVERSAELGSLVLDELARMAPKGLPFAWSARGLGLLTGLELRRPNGAPAGETVLRAAKAMLTAGFILLPEGEHADVIGLSPPLTITAAQLRRAVKALWRVLGEQ